MGASNLKISTKTSSSLFSARSLSSFIWHPVAYRGGGGREVEGGLGGGGGGGRWRGV